MSVAGVSTKANIGDNQKILDFTLQSSHGVLNDPMVFVCGRRVIIFLFRDAKEDYSRDSQGLHGTRFFHQGVDGELMVARHGRDFSLHAFSGAYEQGVNQLFDRQASFLNQSSHNSVHAKAPWPRLWKLHGDTSSPCRHRIPDKGRYYITLWLGCSDTETTDEHG